MILLNFAHPVSEEDMKTIERLCGTTVAEVRDIASQLEQDRELVPQIESMIDAAGLSSRQWQSEALIINLPSLSSSAAVMLAKLHGIMGYFPAVLRYRPVKGAIPPRFELAEILNLQGIRNHSRENRDQ